MLTKKKIECTVTLGQGSFGQSETVVIKDARIHVSLTNCAGDFFGQAEIAIFGLSLEKMGKLITIGPINTGIQGKNRVRIAAGDDEKMQIVFDGLINTAMMVGNAAPDVFLQINAFAGLDLKIQPAGQNSYQGTVSATTILADLASKSGLLYQDKGIKGQLVNAYFSGDLAEQIQACARQVGGNAFIRDGTLFAFPTYGQNSADGETIEVSAETGLIGYPEMSTKGLTLRVVFDLRHTVPGKIRLKSIIPGANGVFLISTVTHILQPFTPQGKWETVITCYPEVTE